MHRSWFLALALSLGALPARAVSPDDQWRTVQTEHFRVHYPLQAQTWALQAAGRLDAIEEAVVVEVGDSRRRRVDVVVMDPFNNANGFAIPMLMAPRMGIFPTAPGPDSGIANYHSWEEDLMVHEDAHLVHLLRPSRNPVVHAVVDGLLGVGPVALKSPAWVIEGYATVVEGRLTGAGRPHSDGRAAFLRMLAMDGRLPRYDELNGSDRWSGGSMRYLVGSAYLEWLEARTHPGALRDLWARMSARKLRSFEDAFSGVFGDDPATLYARFAAELTHDAIELERARPADPDTLWMDTARGTGGPAVSPDGERMAIVLRPKEGPPVLAVYDLAEDEEAAHKRQEDIEKVLAKDPEDVGPVAPRAPHREPVEKRVSGGLSAHSPRWTGDGERLLFTGWFEDGGGRLASDLALWTVGGGTRRVTRVGGVRQADPGDGWAVAVRQRWGWSQLVRVDLDSGAVTDLTPPSTTTVDANPRLSPDGQTVAWLRHDGEWRIALVGAEGGEPRVLATPGQPESLAWSQDGDAVLASLGVGGFVEVWRVPLDGSAPTPLTRSRGGAYRPEPSESGLFYLSPDAEGYDVRRLAWDAVQPAIELDSDVASAVLPPPPVVSLPTLEARDPGPASRYGLGHMEVRPVLGGGAGPGAASSEVGLRVGDVIDRTEFLGIAAWGDQGALSGGVLAASWRGLPVTLQGWGFGYAMPGRGLTLDGGRPVVTGGVLRGAWSQPWQWGGARASLGAWRSVDAGVPQAAGFADLDVVSRRWFGPAWVEGELRGQGQQGAESWGWERGTGELRIGWLDGYVGGSYARGQARGDARFWLGGPHSSLLAPGFSDAWVLDPALLPGVGQGQAHDRLRVELGVPGMVVFGTRHRAWDEDPVGGWTLVGLQADSSAPGQPLVRFPGLRLDTGVACLVEDPYLGRPEQPWKDLSRWSAWVGLTWHPGGQ